MDLKENKGVIFKNEKKNAETHPDYKGQINVNSKLLDISLWVKTSEKGKKYFSASIQEPYHKPAEPPQSDYVPKKLDEQEVTPADDPDGLPF